MHHKMNPKHTVGAGHRIDHSAFLFRMRRVVSIMVNRIFKQMVMWACVLHIPARILNKVRPLTISKAEVRMPI